MVPNQGAFSFGSSLKKAQIVQDLAKHTLKGWNWAENLGGWKSLSEQDLFEVEYWELEQAKLKVQSTAALSLQGKIALVTGAASGIGKACVESLIKQGAVVAALDISPNILNVFKNTAILPIQCDLTKPNEIRFALEKLISNFGGLDIVVSNAGTFPPGKNISEIESQDWQKIIEVNLNSHQYVLKESLPYLEYGIDPTVIFIASKNVKAPGPGVSAYSAAKAALTQLARVAALELGAKGIRVNTIHPNAVFDTGIWSPEALENRAKHYKMSVDEYKKNNLLKVEITSHDIAALVCSMAGPIYKTITGAQINIDGGNDRTI